MDIAAKEEDEDDEAGDSAAEGAEGGADSAVEEGSSRLETGKYVGHNPYNGRVVC